MKHLVLVALAVVLLVACGPTAPVLTEVNLESLLIQPGDLPPGITGAQVRTEPPAMFDGIAPATKTIYQQFAKDSAQYGGVGVFLYDDPAQLSLGYDFITKGMGTGATPVEVGERAVAITGLLDFSEVAFARCAAVAHIRLTGDLDTVVAYAQRLDKRLQAAVCPK